MHRGWAHAVSWPGTELKKQTALQLHLCNSDGWRRNTLAPTRCSDCRAWICSVLSASPWSVRAGVFTPCILASHELFNVILPLCFAMFLQPILGSLEGGEGPSNFFWLAAGRGGLAASCARQCTEDSALGMEPLSSAGRAAVPEAPVSWTGKWQPP